MPSSAKDSALSALYLMPHYLVCKQINEERALDGIYSVLVLEGPYQSQDVCDSLFLASPLVFSLLLWHNRIIEFHALQMTAANGFPASVNCCKLFPLCQQ